MNLSSKNWIVFICAFVCSFAQAVLVIAQDPFGETSTKTDQKPQAEVSEVRLPELTPDLSPSVRLILETLRASKPAKPNDLCRAVQTTLDIEQFQDSKFYLNQLLQLNLNESELFKLNDSVGSDFFLRIHGAEKVQPFGKDFARLVFSATRNEAIKPERLDGLIKQLGDSNNEVRSEAFRDLRRAGAPAVAAMINVFADYERKDEFIPIRNALRAMGDVAMGPLLGAAVAKPLQVRYEAVTALAKQQNPEAYDAAIAVIFNKNSPAPLRETVTALLERQYGRLPHPDEAILKLFQRAKEYSQGRRRLGDDIRIDGEIPYVVVWRWDNDQGKLIDKRVSAETASKLIALDRARDLFAMQPDSVEFRRFYLVSYLDAEKRLIGPELKLDVDAIKTNFIDLSADEIDAAISHAIGNEMIPAAAGGCDILIGLADGDWVVRSQNANSGLGRALQSGDRHLQFAAFRAIGELDPKKAYAGSSYLMSLAIYFAGYGERPSALVGHHMIDQAQDFAVALGIAGVQGRAVNSSRDFFREATTDSNVQFLFVSETLSSPDYTELIQQLRMDWRTRRTPIAIMIEQATSPRASRLAERDSRILVLPNTNDPNSISLQVGRMQELVMPWRFSNEQGQQYATYCVNWLKKVTADRTVYGFYEIGSHFESLSNLIINPLHTAAAIEILGNVATPQAQRRLVDFASQNTAPIGDRQAAAVAFERAVASRGVLLTTDELALQYARYKAAQNESGESQRVYGSILDIIERRSKTVSTNSQ